MRSEYLGQENVDLKLDRRNYVKGSLLDGKRMLILFDSGATKSIISGSFVRGSRYLSNLRPISVTPIKFRLGNGEFLYTDRLLQFEMSIQGQKFRISALIAEHLTGIDLILGTQTLTELGGSLDFCENRFKIPAKKIGLQSACKVVVKPGETKYVVLQGKVPAFLRNGEVVIQANKHLSKLCPTNMLVKLRKGRAYIPVTNATSKTVSLTKDKPAASLNLSQLITVAQPLSTDDLPSFHSHTQTTSHAEGNEFNALQMTEIMRRNLEQYPHMDYTDPLASMTESEVIRKMVKLDDSILTADEKEDIYKLIERYRDAFSLYGELSSCPNFAVDIKLTNDEPFYIRPYFATESDKKVIEAELDKLVKLGILQVGHQSYTSPVLLLPKRGTTEKRVVTDFRFLNSRIKRINHPFPLLAETLKQIGHSEAKVLSCLDLKSAFFCLPLTPKAQQYTGIASYHGGKHYFYKRLAQGLNVSPGLFQSKIDEILSTIPNSREFCIAHHDDIILFSPDKESMKRHLTSVFEALMRNGLKISPKKSNLFRDKVVYMGHKISINTEGHACIEPLGDRCAAIRNMPRPKTPREARRLVGAVNYVSNFFPHMQKVLHPLHKLTRKRRLFCWEDEHEQAFQKIKELLSKPPVLHMPRKTGRLTLYSDTSRVATGSYITQSIDGKEYILGYYSKILPPACQRYSVTELELFGLYINISCFKHLLKGCEFDAFVDHSAIVQLLKSKEQPCTPRLQKLFMKLSEYSFKVGYKRASEPELILADFLSRAPRDDDSEIDHITPIAFSSLSSDVISECNKDAACPTTASVERRVTRQYAKQQGIDIPTLWPKRSNENQSRPTDNEITRTQRERVGRPRVSGSEMPLDTPTPLSEYDIPYGQSAPDPSIIQSGTRPPTTAATEPRLVDKADMNDSHMRPPPELYTPPAPLVSNVESMKTRHIPKQYELDRMMNVIKRKIIRDYNLPIDIRTLKTEQETSVFFKPIYDYLAYDILPNDRKAAKSVKLRAEEYILCNGLLFRLFFNDKDERFVLQLAVPESMAETIISQFHDNLLSSHQGVLRTYLTVRRNFYTPSLFERINNYVKACLRCQQFRNKTDKLRPFHMRVPDSYKPFDRISLDFKFMPKSVTGFQHLMVACDEISRFVICCPLKSLDAETICEAMIQKIFCIFGPPSCLITDAATSLTGKLVTLLCDTLNIDRKVISVENHGSLQVERHIRTVSDFLRVNLNQFGTDWVRFVSTTCYAYNSFSSQHLGNYSPYELVFGREPPNLTSLVFNPTSGLSRTYEEYAEHLKKKFEQISRTVLQLQRVKQEKQNAQISQKLGKNPIYSVGQLVYLFKPTSSSLTANSRKISASWCGPLVINQVLDRTHYILATLKGEILHDVFNFNRLKPCFLRATDERKNITHIQKLKEVLGKSQESGQVNCENSKTPVFTDENGKQLPSVTAEQVSCLCQTDAADLTPHLDNVSENSGLAVPFVLNQRQLEQQLQLVMQAPSDGYMEIHRARFKAGNLQILTSVPIKNADTGTETSPYKFWLHIDKYPELATVGEQVLLDKKIPVCGTPKKILYRLY